MCKPSPVPFHGDTIFFVDYHGGPYVPMRPIAENLGLDWPGQAAKFRLNKAPWGVEMISTPTESGVQEMLCLPLRKLAAWLASINPRKVEPELREKIELYQAESDDALWNYWMKGKAERKKAPAGALPAPKDKYAAYLQEVENLRSRAGEIDFPQSMDGPRKGAFGEPRRTSLNPCAFRRNMGRRRCAMPSELELYIQNQPELVKKYNGQIIALHHGRVEGGFANKTAALEAMKAKYAPGDFMIIKCTPGDSEYTRRFRSRVWFSSEAHL